MCWRIETRDDGVAAATAAGVVLDAFVRAGERDFGLALSGGRVAPVFFGELVRQAARRRVRLAAADFFWADERLVPPDHEESNYRVAWSALLEPLGVGPDRVHRLAGERSPEEAVAAALEDWERWRAGRGRGRAGLDCVVLGVGEDGHVASLFPGNLAADLAAEAPFRAVTGPKPPPRRITMGYGLLWEARLVLVLATGSGKAGVVRAALGGDERLPLTRVLAGRAGRETVVVSGNGVA